MDYFHISRHLSHTMRIKHSNFGKKYYFYINIKYIYLIQKQIFKFTLHILLQLLARPSSLPFFHLSLIV